MKTPYRWNYNIKVKTKEGTYEYEDKLDNLESILDKHKDYEEVRAKKLIKKRGQDGRRTKENN